MTAIEEIVCYSQVQEEGAGEARPGHTGKHQGWSGGRGNKGKTGQSLSRDFHGKAG